MWCLLLGIWYVLFRMSYLVLGIPCFCVWHLVLGIWFGVLGILYLVLGVGYEGLDTVHLVFAIWYAILGILAVYSVYRIGKLVHGVWYAKSGVCY